VNTKINLILTLEVNITKLFPHSPALFSFTEYWFIERVKFKSIFKLNPDTKTEKNNQF